MDSHWELLSSIPEKGPKSEENDPLHYQKAGYGHVRSICTCCNSKWSLTVFKTVCCSQCFSRTSVVNRLWPSLVAKGRYTLATKSNLTRSTLSKVDKGDRGRPCRFGPVHTGDRVERTFTFRWQKSPTFDKVDRVKFDIVASVYRPLATCDGQSLFTTLVRLKHWKQQCIKTFTFRWQKSPTFDKVDRVEHVQLWRQRRPQQTV